jgi:hypothetical protein
MKHFGKGVLLQGTTGNVKLGNRKLPKFRETLPLDLEQTQGGRI